MSREWTAIEQMALCGKSLTDPSSNPGVDEIIEALRVTLRQVTREGDRVRRWKLREALHAALFMVETDAEATLDELMTVQRSLRKNAKPDETCEDFLARTTQAITEWESAA
jgi:hypothetical protein